MISAAALSGHYSFDIHAYRLEIQHQDYYRSCQNLGGINFAHSMSMKRP